MSLEQELLANTQAVKQLASLIQQLLGGNDIRIKEVVGEKPVKEKEVTKPKPKKEKVKKDLGKTVVEKKVEKKTKKPEKVKKERKIYDEIKEEALELIKNHGREELLTLLYSFDSSYKTARDLPEENHQEFLDAIKERSAA